MGDQIRMNTCWMDSPMRTFERCRYYSGLDTSTNDFAELIAETQDPRYSHVLSSMRVTLECST